MNNKRVILLTPTRDEFYEVLKPRYLIMVSLFQWIFHLIEFMKVLSQVGRCALINTYKLFCLLKNDVYVICLLDIGIRHIYSTQVFDNLHPVFFLYFLEFFPVTFDLLNDKIKCWPPADYIGSCLLHLRNFIGKNYQAEYLQLTFLLRPCYLLYAAPLSLLLLYCISSPAAETTLYLLPIQLPTM